MVAAVEHSAKRLNAKQILKMAAVLSGGAEIREGDQVAARVWTGKPRMDPGYVMRRWPRLTAHVIAESLGYATPTVAADIIGAAWLGQKHWCEWIHTCYRCNPRPAVERAIRTRHSHKGYMASYALAKRLVDQVLAGLGEPEFASWF